jgi:hypothetical protein
MWKDATASEMLAGCLADWQEKVRLRHDRSRQRRAYLRAPAPREELARCFGTVLGRPVGTVKFPGIDQPMLVISFPDGGHLSIEFTDEAPGDEHPRLGAWLELRADEDPTTPFQAALNAGLTQVRRPAHPYYFMIPGGRMFTFAPTS